MTFQFLVVEGEFPVFKGFTLDRVQQRCLQLMNVFLSGLWGTHLCHLCVDTRWFAYVLRDRPDDSHGTGGLFQVGGPVADALWFQRFGEALLTLCLVVGGKQKKETKITISIRKNVEHSMPSSSRVHRVKTHTSLRVLPHPFATFGSGAAVSSSLRDPPWSGTWAAWRACHEPAHQVSGEVLLRGSWTAQGPSVPGTLGGTQGPVSVTMVSGVCSVTMVALVACTLLDTGGYPACYQCGVASTQCGGIGSLGAVVPLCQVALLASLPSFHHAYHGSLVTPSICFWTSPCVSPYPCA